MLSYSLNWPIKMNDAWGRQGSPFRRNPILAASKLRLTLLGAFKNIIGAIPCASTKLRAHFIHCLFLFWLHPSDHDLLKVRDYSCIVFECPAQVLGAWNRPKVQHTGVEWMHFLPHQVCGGFVEAPSFTQSWCHKCLHVLQRQDHRLGYETELWPLWDNMTM